MRRIVMLLAALCLSGPAAAKTLTGHMSPQEQATYASMLKSNAAGAHAYRITREYVDTCRQVQANPAVAIDLPDQPDDFDDHYVTADDHKLMKAAIQKALSAYIDKQEGLKSR